MEKIIFTGTMLLLLGLTSLTSLLQAQVMVTPTMIFMDDRTGVGEVYLYNTSDTPREVTISVKFAYVGSDASGNMEMIYDDKENKATYGLDDLIRVFPRQLILPSNASQTIQLMVMPLRDMKDSVYWTRLIISAVQVTADIENPEERAIGAQISYVLRQNIPVFYLKGSPTTGVTIQDVRTEVRRNGIDLFSEVTVKGNAPFIGSINARLLDKRGRELTTGYTPTSIYFKGLRSLFIPKPEEGIAPGTYNLEISYETHRRDVNRNNLIQAEPVRHTVQVAIE